MNPSSQRASPPSALATEEIFLISPPAAEQKTMPTQRQKINTYTINGPDWPKEIVSDSDFECDLSSDDSLIFSGYGSTASEDLDLYDSRCVR